MLKKNITVNKILSTSEIKFFICSYMFSILKEKTSFSGNTECHCHTVVKLVLLVNDFEWGKVDDIFFTGIESCPVQNP